MADNSGKTSRFDLIFGGSDQTGGLFSRLQSGFASLTKNVQGLTSGLKDLHMQSGLGKLTTGLSGVKTGLQNVIAEGRGAIGQMSSMVGKIGVAFAGASGGALALAKATASAGSEAAKAAQRAGVGLTVWQEYAYAAQRSGMETETLERGLRHLQGAALDAVGGSKEKAKLLQMAGINPKTAKGEVKSAETLMLELADKVKKLTDAGQTGKATDLVTSLVGERGAAFVPLLSRGSEAIKNMRMQAHELGLVFSEENVAASKKFGASFTNLGLIFKGWGYSIGNLLLPPITKVVEKLGEWVMGTRETIGGGFLGWAKSLNENIDGTWKSIEGALNGMMNFGHGVQTVVGWLGGWGNVMKGLGLLIAGKFMIALGGLTMSFLSLGAAIMTTPVGWFAAAVAGIAGGAYLIYENWGAIKDWFAGQWAEVKGAFDKSWTLGILTVLNKFNPVVMLGNAMNGLVQYLTGFDLKSIGLAWIDGIWQGMQEKWGQLTGWVGTLGDSVRGFFGLEGAGGAAPLGAAPSAAPVNLGPTTASIQQSRTETVERQQLDIRVSSPDGTPLGATMSGGNSDNVSLTGQQMGSAGLW
ncbi:hypothetical protein [uncultured Desulfovibrio sp.]|uniref:hypothetical protein n=1 Tax=uncultured Desulfovibrio sp. TaxID=167968 RepID=UPI0025E7945A|nr:hypothetical protein [uncultured Desulfovibrio sp.]